MTISFKQDIIPHKFRNRFLRNSSGNTIITNSGSNSGDSSHADSADYANTAGTAQTANEAINLTNNSPLWSKFLRKDATDTASEIITFTKGLISTLVSKFKAGFKIGENDQYEINSHGHATLNTVTGTQANFDKFAGPQGAITNVYGTQADYTNINGAQGHITHVAGNQADYTNINGAQGHITHITGVQADYNTFSGHQGWIDNLYSDSIETDYLEVKRAAHFFKLIIDEIKSTKGMMLITAANAKFDLVETISVNGQNRYRCYFRSKDPDTEKEITNDFETGDLVICQTFNGATGIQYNVSNKYYWRKCIGTGSITKVINNQEVPVHYIDLSMAYGEYDPQPNGMTFNMVPEAGDEVSLLGNVSDTSRQSAILISAYDVTWIDKEPAGTPDTQKLHAPFIVSYYGINTFDLYPYRWSIISRNLNVFKGDLKVNDNGTWTSIQDYVAQHASLGPQGPVGPQGNDGQSGKTYSMVDNGSQAYVRYWLDNNNDVQKQLNINLNLSVTKTIGSQGPQLMSYADLRSFPTQITSALDGMYVYVKMCKNTNLGALWYISALNPKTNNDTSSPGVYTFTFTSTDEAIMDANTKITIGLIPGKVPYDNASGTIWDTTQYDTWEVTIPVTSGATFQIIQGQNASIKALVTGQQGLQSTISTLEIGQQGIQSQVTGLQAGVVGLQSTVNQMPGQILSEVIDFTKGTNLLPSEGWTDEDGHLLAKAFFDPLIQKVQNYSSDGAYSPILHLKADTYCFSAYGPNTTTTQQVDERFIELFIYRGTDSKLTPGSYDHNSEGYVNTLVSGDTYTTDGVTYKRYYFTFTLATDSYVSLNVYEDDDFILYRPQLERGSTPSTWQAGTTQNRSSAIDQKADSIDLSIRNGLQTTGINISNGTVRLKANKVTFENSDGSVTNKISIDPTTGTLNAIDGNFEGTVHANNLYHGIMVVSIGSNSGFMQTLGEKLYYCNTDLGSRDGFYTTNESSWYDSDWYINRAFTEGQYYTSAQIYTLSNGDLQGDSTLAISGFTECTGYNDIIYNVAAVDTGSRNYMSDITLPAAESVPGKIIDIFAFCYRVDNEVFNVKSVNSYYDDTMASLIYFDYYSYEWKVELSQQSVGQSIVCDVECPTRFMSVPVTQNGVTKYYWLKTNFYNAPFLRTNYYTGSYLFSSPNGNRYINVNGGWIKSISTQAQQ